MTSSMQPPGGKPPRKVVIAFRCEPALLEWVRKNFEKKGGSKLSEILNWLVGLGRLHYEALHPLREQIEAAAKEEALSEMEVIRHLVRLGLETRQTGKGRKK